MSILPGWDSLASTTAYARWFQIAGFVVLFLVAVFAVLAFIYSEHKERLTPSGPQYPLTGAQTQKIGRALDTIPGDQRFKVVAFYPTGADVYAKRLVAVFKKHGWEAEPEFGLILNPNSSGMGFGVSKNVAAGKVPAPSNARTLMRILDAAGVPYGLGEFDISDDAFLFIVASPPD